MNTIDIVRNTIKENSLIKNGDKVLCALSGGSDSVAMVDILSKLSDEMGFEIFLAHVNHNIREEAKNDEEFVREYSEKLGVKCFIKNADVLAYAKEKGISTELAGREIRYAFFDEITKKYNIDKIATAHNKNDSAESILLHIIRGCGIDGLSGIPVIRDDNIIRPVINLSKEEIVKYCKENNLMYVEDKTNFKTDYTRNKIRLKIIPQIENEINENFINTLVNNSKIYRQTSDFLDNYTKKVYDECCSDKGLEICKISKEADIVVKTAVQMYFVEYKGKNEKLPLSNVEKIVELIRRNQTSKTLNLPGGDSAKIEYGRLFFEKTQKEKKDFKYTLEIGKKLYIEEAGVEILVESEDEVGKNSKDKIYFYLDDCDNLYVRNRKAGDVFEPVKMDGKKRISDLFCDMKIPSAKRDKIPLLLKNDDIIWVCRIRADRRFLKGKNLMSCTVFERSSN